MTSVPFSQRFAVIGRGLVEIIAERAGKRRVIGKTDVTADLRDGFFAVQEFARKEQTLARDVLMNAVARIFLEFAHEIIAAQIDEPREIVNAQRFLQMFGDIGENLLDLRIVDGFCLRFEFVTEQGAVQDNHKLHKENFLRRGLFFRAY